MAPKAPKRTSTAASAKGKAAKQTQLEQLPLLKKPIELIGTQIKVPGAYWAGRMSAEEKDTLYVCAVREYSALHTFAGGRQGRRGHRERGGPERRRPEPGVRLKRSTYTLCAHDP